MISCAHLHASHTDCFQILLYNAIGICGNGRSNEYPILAEHCTDPVHRVSDPLVNNCCRQK